MHFGDRLSAAVRATGSPALVGLDPFLDRIPAEFAAASAPDATRAERAAAVGDFLCAVIEVVAGKAPAVKPQSAFFEALGADGVWQWERVVAAAKDAGLLVIGDVKRGDIGTTANAYAQAFLSGVAGTDPRTLCDAVTLNPYLGSDSIRPFLECPEETGIYVLVRTSNPSGAEFQGLGEPSLAERVADAVHDWGAELCGQSGLSRVGAVVGATHPSELGALRERMPHAPLLLPGYGAQGAGAADVVGAYTAKSGGLASALVNSSRGILYAYQQRPGTAWRDATREALEDMTGALCAAVEPAR